MATNRQKQIALRKRQQDAAAFFKEIKKYKNTGVDWNPLTHPIEYAVVCGVNTPGLLKFEGLGRKFKWDFKTGPGISGANPIYRGTELAQFAMLCDIYDTDDWAQLRVFLGIIPKQIFGRQASACPTQHPMLAIPDPPIRAITIDSWTLSDPDEMSISHLRLEVHEYRPIVIQQAAIKKVAIADERLDPADEIIKRMTGQAQLLAGDLNIPR